ncbi:hypothetical protein ACB094_05G125400 [Castanea mollissima]
MIIHNIGHSPLQPPAHLKQNTRPQRKKAASHNVSKVANFQSPLIYLNAQPVKVRVPKKKPKREDRLQENTILKKISLQNNYKLLISSHV